MHTFGLLVTFFALTAALSAPIECYSHSPIRLADAPRTPGFTTAFSQKGLDYVKDVGIKVLKEKVPSFVIPPVNGTADVTLVGKVDYNISNLHISSVQFGDAKIQIEPNQGLTVVIAASGAAGSLNWHWEMQSWPHTHGTGTADFNFTLSIKLSLKFQVLDDHLQIASIPATVSVDNFKVDIHSTNDWFYKLLLKLFNSVIKSSISSGLQDAFSTSITESIDKALLAVPIRQQIIDPVIFDIGLIRDPLFTNSVFRLYEAGDSYDKRDPTPCPSTTCHAVDLPETLSPNRMVQMYLSDYVPTSLARAFMLSGLLQYNVTQDLLPPNFPFTLNTRLLAAILPTLQKKYPDNPVSLVVRAASTPNVRFVENSGVNVTSETTITFLVQNDTQWIEAFVLEADILAEAAASLGGWQVYGSVSKIGVTASVKSSQIGQIDISPLQYAMNWGIQYALPSINTVLKNGISLPSVPGFSISGSDITYGKGFLSLAIDIQYDAPLGK